MDQALWKAASEGDVKFLKEAVAVQPPEYFLHHFMDVGNILHRAVWNGNVEFLREAKEILPTDIKKQLLQTTDVSKYTVLHVAAVNSDMMVVHVIIEMYGSLSWGDDDDEDHVKPWLALTRCGKTPLNLALTNYNELDGVNAIEMLFMDDKRVNCIIADGNGNTPLYNAIDRGFSQVAEHILRSPLPSTSLVGTADFLSLYNSATNNCEGNVLMFLLETSGCVDNDGDTPLHSALYSVSTQDKALAALSACRALCNTYNNRGESPLFLAVKSGCDRVVEEIMRTTEPVFRMLRRTDETTVLHCLSSCSENTGRMLLEKYWWMVNLRDDQGKTALHYAKQADAIWLVNLLKKPSLIQRKEFNWIRACEREDNIAVIAFIETCGDLQRDCRLKNDSPLHHIKLNTSDEYAKLLKNPSITVLKNMTDHDDATPLHRALEREDIHFVKALLLDDDVQKTIEDSHGRTAMNLLAELCKGNEEWDKMCKDIKVNPNLKTSYIQLGTNLDQIRNTLSVVAALLATITFAAGFTLPGGLNSDNGEALLARKAGFLVFLLADVYAMCTSMLVLFCLIWSMVSDLDMTRILVDRSVFLLMQSLYGTLLAFIAGIYTVIANSSLWAAILILVMCSIIGIAANRSILHKVISKFVPATEKKKKHPRPTIEEEELLEIKVSNEDEETIQ